MSPKQSSKVFIQNSIGEMLVVQRSAGDTDRALAFDLPGGGLLEDANREPLETPVEAALRETREEIGLELHASHLEPVTTSLYVSLRHHHPRIVHFFAAILDSAAPVLRIQSPEIQTAFWDPQPLARSVERLGHESQRYAGQLLVTQRHLGY